MRRSIEVEYWVVDESGRLTDPGPLTALEGAEREFVEPLLEIKTTPCETTAELRRELVDRVDHAVAEAKSVDRRLVPLATPLVDASVGDNESARTRIQDRVVGEAFDHVRHCAGTHIHFEQRPGAVAAQHNLLTAFDPAFALVNSTPYAGGEWVGAGARSKLYRREAYADLPQQGALWRYITDRTEWQARLRRAADRFRAAAETAGVDPERFSDHFDPESSVWIPIKLREEFSTVEWRSPDTTLPSQVVTLADELAEPMARVESRHLQIADPGHVTDERIDLPRFETVTEAVDAAMEVGLESDSLRRYLARMGLSVDAFDPPTHTFDRTEIDHERARELRLAAASTLEQDVRRAHPV